MSHTCHRFWKCYKTLMFCPLLTWSTIPCACHAKAHLNVQKWSIPYNVLHFWLLNVLRATTACTISTSQLPKVVRSWCALYILTSKCASRHNGVHYFHISTSKSGPELVCFVHFDFEMCFAPQRRALFRHLNFKKCSEREVLSFFTCKGASRHNGVQFFISHLPSGLRTRRFSEPTFRPSGATNHWKNTVFRDFPTFSRICIFFLLSLSLFWSSFFFSSLLWLFSPLLIMCPYCRKFDFQTSFDQGKRPNSSSVFLLIGKSIECRLASIEIFTEVDHPEFWRRGPSKINSLMSIPYNCLGGRYTNQHPTLHTINDQQNLDTKFQRTEK